MARSIRGAPTWCAVSIGARGLNRPVSNLGTVADVLDAQNYRV